MYFDRFNGFNNNCLFDSEWWAHTVLCLSLSLTFSHFLFLFYFFYFLLKSESIHFSMKPHLFHFFRLTGLTSWIFIWNKNLQLESFAIEFEFHNKFSHLSHKKVLIHFWVVMLNPSCNSEWAVRNKVHSTSVNWYSAIVTLFRIIQMFV